jgi:hypothetical protein
MIDRDDLDVRLATALAPMLLAAAVFSLTALSLIPKPDATFTDEFLAALAALCIFGTALVVDSALDTAKVTERARVTLLGGGYLLFCIAVGALTTAVPIIYATKQADAAGEAYAWQSSIIYFIGAGAAVSLKLMWFRDRNAFLILMILFYALSVHALWH